MARIPLIQEQTILSSPSSSGRTPCRPARQAINIYRMLLNSPALAEGWSNHSNAVRWKSTLDGRLREIVIIRLGDLTGSQYVLRQHVPALALADGVTLAECDALADWRPSACSERERVALAYADTMTRHRGARRRVRQVKWDFQTPDR